MPVGALRAIVEVGRIRHDDVELALDRRQRIAFGQLHRQAGDLGIDRRVLKRLRIDVAQRHLDARTGQRHGTRHHRAAGTAAAADIQHAQRMKPGPFLRTQRQSLTDEVAEPVGVRPEEHRVLGHRRISRVKEQVVTERGDPRATAQQGPTGLQQAGPLQCRQHAGCQRTGFERKVPAEHIAQGGARTFATACQHALVCQRRRGGEAVTRGRHFLQQAGRLQHVADSTGAGSQGLRWGRSSSL